MWPHARPRSFVGRLASTSLPERIEIRGASPSWPRRLSGTSRSLLPLPRTISMRSSRSCRTRGQRDQLGDAKPRRVEHLEQAGEPQRLEAARRRTRAASVAPRMGGREQAVDLARSTSTFGSGRPRACRSFDHCTAAGSSRQRWRFGVGKPVKLADRGEPARRRRCLEAAVGEGARQIAAQVGGGRRRDGPLAARRVCAGEIGRGRAYRLRACYRRRRARPRACRGTARSGAAADGSPPWLRLSVGASSPVSPQRGCLTPNLSGTVTVISRGFGFDEGRQREDHRVAEADDDFRSP